MTIQNSTQYANQIAIPPVIMEANQHYGKLRVAKINYTQSGAGSAGSTARLYKFPSGKIMFCGGQSQLKVSALGTSRTLDIGYAAYMAQDGTTVTADVDAIDDGLDVSTASTFNLGSALADGTLTLTSRNGVVLIGTILAGTIPDAATIQGTIVYAVE